jgi:hypothetical protein
MSNLSVTFGLLDKSNLAYEQRSLDSHTVTFDNDPSVQSLAAPHSNGYMMVCSTADCWIKFGLDPTAQVGGTSMFLAKGVPMSFKVRKGIKVAAIAA